MKPWTVIACLLLGAGTALGTPASPAELAFEKHIRPLLAEHCLACHGPKKQMGGLRLDSRPALLRGGDNGPAIQPGDPDASRLLQAVRHAGDLKMPPRKKLPEPAIAALAAWIRQGAVWPEAVRATNEAEAWKRHWAFQPVRRPAIPAVKAPSWARNPIDHFLLAALEAHGLTASPEADRRTLIRRVTFDLIGLPPTPEEVEAFVHDPRPDAYEHLVDRLLASPRHGERWARHWLDVARFADTKGYVFFEEANYPWAWTYRDYVIEAINTDLPYDRFLLEQLAADLLDSKDRRSLRALGFLTLGGRFMNNVHDIIDDRIDVVTRGLLGLTVSCARCHDHKFDPVPAADYYSLYGVFASCAEPAVPPLFDEAPTTKLYGSFARELRQREKALDDFLAQKFAEVRKAARSRLPEYLLAAHARRGQPRGDDFMFIADGTDLNPTMIVRYQAYLERTARSPHRIWAPWHALSALPETEFAARTKTLRFDPGSLNPFVARAFATPPASLKEAASRYGKLFAEVDRSTPLDDPHREELRLVLYGADAPADVQPGLFSDLELLPDRPAQAHLQKLRKAVEQWRSSGPAAPPRAHVLVDLPRPHEPVLFRRGNPNNPGERVPRQFLAFLSGTERRPFRAGSGRLELAHAIVARRNPLTARVAVNRLWLHHFGRGLVETAGDFGLRATPPSHPKLLDWLASELVDHGWSLRHLHRLVLTSAAYRQSSSDRPTDRTQDPENRLLGRFPRRHLDLEALRDALLAVGDQLDGRIGGPSVTNSLTAGVRRRTLYSFIDRLHVPGLFRTFDFPGPDASSPQRDSTLVPQQALFLMNSPFAVHAARTLAGRAQGADTMARVHSLYRICYGRHPTAEEEALARTFLRAGAFTDWQRYTQALLLSNEFVYVD